MNQGGEWTRRLVPWLGLRLVFLDEDGNVLDPSAAGKTAIIDSLGYAKLNPLALPRINRRQRYACPMTSRLPLCSSHMIAYRELPERC